MSCLVNSTFVHCCLVTVTVTVLCVYTYSRCMLSFGKLEFTTYFFNFHFLGPVTLTGQDYVLVESGCTCRPKFSRPGSDPNPASIIPSFWRCDSCSTLKSWFNDIDVPIINHDICTSINKWDRWLFLQTCLV